jgi:hypothetical protein
MICKAFALLIFVCYFFGCADGATMPEETCVGKVANQQAKMVAEECNFYGYLLVEGCIKKVARERILIAIEYAKLCQ